MVYYNLVHLYNIAIMCDDVTNSKLDDILPVKGLIG